MPIDVAPCHLDILAAEHQLDGLAELLRAAVAGGAGIGWTAVPSLADARAFWQRCLASAARGERGLWVAADGNAVLGTVQLITDLPQNGAHRAEIAKVMVSPAARRQGLASRLMDAAEAEALARSRDLLVLDTNSGSPAERLYHQRGYQLAGRIPGYSRTTEGALHPTSVMFKRFGPAGLQVRPAQHDAPEALALQESLSALLHARYGSDGKAGFAGFSTDGSAFAIALDAGGAAVGCGALRPLAGEPGCGEIKRMFAARPGRGIGATLLAYLEHEAWLLGYRRLRLETRWANEGAVAFYRARGYAVGEAYGSYRGRAESACFEKLL